MKVLKEGSNTPVSFIWVCGNGRVYAGLWYEMKCTAVSLPFVCPCAYESVNQGSEHFFLCCGDADRGHMSLVKSILPHLDDGVKKNLNSTIFAILGQSSQ